MPIEFARFLRLAWCLTIAIMLAGCQTQQQGPIPPDELNRGLLKAARENQVDEIRRLVAAGGDANLLPTSTDYPETPLMAASAAGHVTAVDALLAAGANPNRREGGGFWGTTPLMVAARLGHEKVVERLLDAGANPFARFGPFQTNGAVGGGSYTALDQAVANGHPDAVRRLLLAGASVTQGDLYIAITRGNVELVRLVMAGGASLTERFPWNGRTPLEEAHRLPESSRGPIVSALQDYLPSPRP